MIGTLPSIRLPKNSAIAFSMPLLESPAHFAFADASRIIHEFIRRSARISRAHPTEQPRQYRVIHWIVCLNSPKLLIGISVPSVPRTRGRLTDTFSLPNTTWFHPSRADTRSPDSFLLPTSSVTPVSIICRLPPVLSRPILQQSSLVFVSISS